MPINLKEHQSGGELPPVMDLLNGTINEFLEHPAEYSLAGLGQFAVLFPLTFVIICGLYLALGIASVIAMAVGFALVSLLGETIGALLTVVVAFVCYAIAIILPVTLLITAGVTLQLSLYRAIRAHELGEETIGFSAAFSTLNQDLGKSVTIATAMSVISLLAISMCYVPVLFVPLVFGLATPAVALHQEGAGTALMRSFNHVKAHLSWHLGFWAIGLAILIGSSLIPVIGGILGPVVSSLYITRGYRAIFGDSDSAYLEALN